MPDKKPKKLEEIQQPIVFFDGVCNLCNSWVQLLIKMDKKERFLFAPLQGEFGKAMQELHFTATTPAPDSIILLDKGSIKEKSAAVLSIASYLGGSLHLLRIGLLFPNSFNDLIYDWVAKNRYRFFGKKDQCMIPSPELKGRFLP